jgi:nicotinamidase-related amidase
MAIALIIGDVQAGIVDVLFPGGGAVLAPLAAALPEARDKGATVVYVRAALRADPAEVPARNVNIAWMYGQGDLFQESSSATSVHPDIAPLASEAVLVKRRGSAFAGTDLEAILRARGVTEVALAGVATSGVVLHTLVDAADRDYAVTVLRDCCADPEPDVHEFLLERVFQGRGARVLNSGNWLREL